MLVYRPYVRVFGRSKGRGPSSIAGARPEPIGKRFDDQHAGSKEVAAVLGGAALVALGLAEEDSSLLPSLQGPRWPRSAPPECRVRGAAWTGREGERAACVVRTTSYVFKKRFHSAHKGIARCAGRSLCTGWVGKCVEPDDARRRVGRTGLGPVLHLGC